MNCTDQIRRARPNAATGLIHVFCAFLVLHAFPICVHADIVKLNNSGELRGKISRSNGTKPEIHIETITGALVVVEREQTQFVTLRSPAVEEYESRGRHLIDSAESHWELSEWCRLQGLTKQRNTHLRRVTELSPDHEKAQLALNRVWNQGHWIERDELMASQGLVKYKNKYITRQELEMLEKTAEDLKHERYWFPRVRNWIGWLSNSNSVRVNQGLKELKSIDDPRAATAVIKYLSVDERVDVRLLSVAILRKIPCKNSIAGLVRISLSDESNEVRTAAFEAVGRDYYQEAQVEFLKSLKSEANAVVGRAATALGQMGDKKAIGPLIEALVTVHQYQVTTDTPVNPSYSFSTDGNFAPNVSSLPPDVALAVRTGQMYPPIFTPPTDLTPKKVVSVRVEHYNKEVLEALEKLTKKNFGYNKRDWSLWWSADKNLGGKLPN